MAEANAEDITANTSISSEEKEKVLKVCQIRELYHGRFNGREAITLLKKHGWDISATNKYIMETDAETVRTLLAKTLKLPKTPPILPASAVAMDLHRQEYRGSPKPDTHAPGAQAQIQEIPVEIRQFACKIDRRMWWRRVPANKTVSKCFTCHQRYNAIPRYEEWGLGEFACTCGHDFRAFAMMERSLLHTDYTGKSESLCHGCYSQICYPIRILPPLKKKKPEGIRNGSGWRQNWSELEERRYEHTCTAPNCYKHREPYAPDEPLIHICVHVHPNTLREVVHGDGSNRRVSTGFTVDTFLYQDDIKGAYKKKLDPVNESDGRSSHSSD